MSMNSALNSAVSGLTASARMAEVTASNVSNALTEGYARREVLLAPKILGDVGAGVAVMGIARHTDGVLLQDLRLSTADQGARALSADFLSRLEKTLGTPDEAGSLSARIAMLERTLVEAAGRPESDARLSAVVDAARGVTQNLGDVSRMIQSERQSADTQIASEVKRLNEALAGVAELNTRIRVFRTTGRDFSTLMDQRQQLIDTISSIVPVKEVMRDMDQVALYTKGGTIILESRPVQFGFTKSGLITPDMTIASGALSGLTINGEPIQTAPNGGRLGEGRLSALFNLRDTLAPEAQAKVDGIARDMIERVTDPAVDPTLTAGMTGLFTDRGVVFDPLDEVGLAERIRVNTVVVPEQGGDLWRLREGLGAGGPGSGGMSDRLAALANALSEKRVQVSGGLPAGARSLAEFASDVLSSQSAQRLSAETGAVFAAARRDALKSELLKDGVDTDQEMQNLLLIEKAYAANAKVIQTVDEMLNVMLGL